MLGPNSPITVQTLLTGATPLLLYTVPAGQIAIINELVFNIIVKTAISYYIGGNGAQYLHLPATTKDAGTKFRELLSMALVAGTTIYGACTSTGDASIEILGETWNV